MKPLKRYTTSHGTMCNAAAVAELEHRYAELEAKCAELEEAAKPLVERWDTPMWKWDEHTGTLIYRLRAAIAKAEGGNL